MAVLGPACLVLFVRAWLSFFLTVRYTVASLLYTGFSILPLLRLAVPRRAYLCLAVLGLAWIY